MEDFLARARLVLRLMGGLDDTVNVFLQLQHLIDHRVFRVPMKSTYAGLCSRHFDENLSER